MGKKYSCFNFKRPYLTFFIYKLGQICLCFEAWYVYFSMKQVSLKNLVQFKRYNKSKRSSTHYLWAYHNPVVFKKLPHLWTLTSSICIYIHKTFGGFQLVELLASCSVTLSLSSDLRLKNEWLNIFKKF